MAAAPREVGGPSNLPGSPILSGSPFSPCPQDAGAAAGRIAGADKPAAATVAPAQAYVRAVGSGRHRWQQTLDRPESRKTPASTALPPPTPLSAAQSAASGRRGNCL